MAANSDPSTADIVCYIRAFIMTVLAADAIALRPNIPRVRGPLTPLAEKIFRTLMFQFENVITGLCMPSLAVIGKKAGCSQTALKDLLPALARTEFLSWKHGNRKRVKTHKGWRVVRGSNHYQILCPPRHIENLRRELLKAFGGKGGPLIQKLVARYTPQTAKTRTAAEGVETPAADFHPGTVQTAPTQGAAPSRTSPASENSVEVGGVRVEDPKLGRVLAGLWAAMEKRGA